MKFDPQTQQQIAELLAQTLGVKLLDFKAKLAIPNNGRFPDRNKDAPGDGVHQLAAVFEVQAACTPRLLAFLFNAVPDRVYHKNLLAIDSSALEVIQVMNHHIHDRLAEDTDGDLSCMVYVPELDKQPADFPRRFSVVGDFYF